jgi:hypothetical protein
MEASAGWDLMAGALLLRLLSMIADVKEVETRPPGDRPINDGQRPN